MSEYGSERTAAGLDIFWDLPRALRRLTARSRRRGIQIRPDAVKTSRPEHPFTRLGKQTRVDEPDKLMSLERAGIRRVDMRERRPNRCAVVITLKTGTEYLLALDLREQLALIIVDELRSELLLTG